MKKFKAYLKGTDDLLSPVDHRKVIVVDVGSIEIRIGISGDNFPILVFPFVVGKSKHKDSSDLTQTKLPESYGHKAI